MTKVVLWYKLDGASVDKVKLTDDADVADLKKAIKAEWSNKLKDVDAPELQVFAAGGTSELQGFEPIPTDTTGLNPLIVIAPETQQAQTLPPVSERTWAGLEIIAEEAITKKRTIVLSEATVSTKNDLIDMLALPENGASWLNKPTISQRVDGFSWLDVVEDSPQNRTAYMAHLNAILQIPTDYALADAQQNRSLLTVHLLRGAQESRKLSGTTDVAIAKSQHVHNKVYRNHIETLFELKKPENLQRKDHTPQTVGEHFAASYLNPNHPVVSVLTDLNDSWTFFWFAREDNHYSDVALYSLLLNGGEAASEAKYVLDSLYDQSSEETLPTTFSQRLPFQDVLDSVVQNKKKRARRELGCSSSPDQGPKPSSSGGADQYPKTGTDSSTSSSRSGDTMAHQNNQGAAGVGGGGAPMNMARTLSLFAPPSERDVANELDLLDMVDESEQYEIVRSFAAKHIVPYMRG